ncbi:hypothetical protein PsorP6_011659 [Peronosclerospora sorghi]|uniref:Uncharacterized protein n=1 Tax=Peronosclerospora sorghi TaxID=230839 RepID=A0ACC0WL66_9STRA|nr:hypothetical protein PsorP6_011659 [Peronosclerospora sorghi]
MHMTTSSQVTVVICVSDKAFDAFKESSPNFHLADLLYNLFQKVHEARAPSLDAPSASGVDPENLDMLFSECTGVNELENSVDGTNNDPTEYLTQYLNNIELREHQKQALRWTLWREDQSRSEEENVDPMWEKRDFHFKGSYYVNPLEKSASLSQPERPRPCRGGILADDMGMGKTMVMLSLIAYQKHFREERAMTNHLEAREIRKAASKTLVVCPLSLLHQWKREAYERFVSNTLSVHVYYGNDGTTSTGLTTTPFGNSDVVLTTYGVLSAEFRKNGLVATTEWLRVILDEAHSIKNRATHYFKTCSALKATHRWCLTGTPIQNSLEDLFSLLCFLEYEPWSRAAWWKRVINKPYEDGDVNALGRLKAILTPLLLRRTKHSRDRHGHRIVDLPPKHIELVQLDFSPDERAFYQALYDQSRAEFNGFVASGTAMTSYVAIFALLLRLRQACDHPLLALGKDVEQELKPTEASATSAFQRQDNESPEAYYQRIAAQLQKDLVKSHLTQHLVNDADGLRRKETLVGGLTASYIQSVIAQVEDGLESQECPICLDSPRSAVLTPCAHVLCDQCLRDSIEMDPGNGCPVCRTAVDLAKVFKLPPPSASRAPTNDFQAVEGSTNESLAGDVQERVTVFESAKMKQLLGDLNALKLENGKTASSTQKRKVVVFSQWTSMLQMVSRLLTTHGVSHCTFSGDVKHVGRERVLRTFATDPDVEVLLMSLKAGGLGLNLTCASVVILLDPWWNPGVEEQAIDRVHRLGQTQHVTVKRYVMKETVEDMMLQLQERKATLAKNVLVPAKAAYEERQRERLTLDDLRTFFR